MGICSSYQSASVSTAKLIHQDGQLQEFPYPVKVSYVLQMNPACFICNSDELGFDDFVSAIKDDEELQPGQLYFALPLNRLKYPLQREEMAALAVKASFALMKSSSADKCRYRLKWVVPTVFSGKREVKSMSEADSGGGPGMVVSRRRGGSFRSKLSSIPE
ncbi:PREDICTED: uncharacterized protein LOC104587400 [Nelumbo nucifera]|uniref:Uncharacterized protein LOC104587400 n=2 Tax=Nelumbo nucifera TaxID=4432 RepID=A0A1U7YVH6_NELNU|nr:PREDICTED: uncharacterized protein LOC104587400 [Nelumbo nucifera]DAD21790.1 TPA_asm: hypothetical protein HUJ06_023253 [Nelumbo nucifera]